MVVEGNGVVSELWTLVELDGDNSVHLERWEPDDAQIDVSVSVVELSGP